MRKLIILPIVLGIAALASCEKSKETPKEPFVIRVGTESTKTSLGPKNGETGKYPTYWSVGDVISINGKLSQALSAEDISENSASFTFDAKPSSASVYNVVYPGSASAAKVSLNGEAPLVGHTDDLGAGVSLSNCAAIVSFPIKGTVSLTSMDVNTPGGEKISGTFSLGLDGSGALDGSMTPDGGALSTMAYSFGGGIELDSETARTICFPVPAGTYSKGVRAVLHASNGTAMTLSFFTSGATLSAAKVAAFPNISFQAGKEILFTSTDPLSGTVIDMEAGGGAEGMGSEDATKSTSITVGTYNVWAPSARKAYWDPAGSSYDPIMSEQRKWSNSYKAVADMINWLDCDIIGIQEVTKMVYQTTLTSGNEDYDGNVHTLNSLLPNYEWVIYNAANTTYDNLTNNTTANGLGNTDAILYKSSVLSLVSKGRCWITGTRNEHPHTDGTPNWDGIGTNRSATWAKFTHKASGKQFVFIVTHLDLPNAAADDLPDDPSYSQRRNIQELITWFAPTYAGELPSIIVGDMNVDAGDTYGNYARLTAGRWQDVYDIMKADGNLSYVDRQVKGTMPANKNEEGGLSTWRPDHVLCYGFTPSYYKVGREKFATNDGTMHWPSDHFPVKVILNF